MNDGVLDGVRERVVERVVDVDPHALPLVDPNVRLGVLGADLIDDVSHGAGGGGPNDVRSSVGHRVFDLFHRSRDASELFAAGSDGRDNVFDRLALGAIDRLLRAAEDDRGLVPEVVSENPPEQLRPVVRLVLPRDVSHLDVDVPVRVRPMSRFAADWP